MESHYSWVTTQAEKSFKIPAEKNWRNPSKVIQELPKSCRNCTLSTKLKVNWRTCPSFSCICHVQTLQVSSCSFACVMQEKCMILLPKTCRIFCSTFLPEKYLNFCLWESYFLKRGLPYCLILNNLSFCVHKYWF